MKTLFNFFVVCVLFTQTTFAQDVKYEQVSDNIYSFTRYNDGVVSQQGYYKLVDDNLTIHGTWKDSFGTIAKFENGKLVWIKPKGQKRYTYKELEMYRLKSRIRVLEERLASIDI